MRIKWKIPVLAENIWMQGPPEPRSKDCIAGHNSDSGEEKGLQLRMRDDKRAETEED